MVALARALALSVAMLCIGGCMKVATMKVGEWVPAAELRQNQGQLRRWVAGEISSGQTRRAFYGLETMKTRPFASRHYARGSSEAVAQADLRGMFEKVFVSAVDPANAPLVASRGLKRVEHSAAAVLDDSTRAGEAAYWEDIALFQARIESYLPYGHAMRHSYAPVSSIEASGLVGEDGIGVSYFIDEERVYLFVIEDGPVKVYQLPKSTSEIKAASRELLAAVNRRPQGPHDEAWRAPAELLYHELFGPIEGRMRDASLRTLYVVPDGFLANVPFGLLLRQRPEGKQMLMESMRVSYLPSFTMYRRQLMRASREGAPSMLTIGNPRYSVSVPDLPDAEKEARIVSGIYEHGRLLAGQAADESSVVDELQHHNIAHFATHGVLLGDQHPGASSLLLASDGPVDGFLSAAEISRLDLSHMYLAVLSACETSVSTDQGASLDLGSLTGAFMVAGTPTVMGSLWKVSDHATTSLLLQFYAEFLERGAGDAIRRAQLALRAQRGYEHPYYWGAFVLYGWDK